MATLLERTMYPQMDTSGLTSGVDYFGSVGNRRNVILNRAAPTLPAADNEVPQGTGFSESGGESGFGTPSSAPGTGVSPQGAFNMGMTGAGLSLLGQATQNPDLGIAGGFLGASAAASQGNLAPFGSMTASMMGATPIGATAVGTGIAAAQGNLGIAQGVNALGNLAVPGYSLANLGLVGATGFFGDTPTSIGDIAEFGMLGYDTFGNVGPVDAAQGGKAISMSPDQIGSIAAVQGMPASAAAMPSAIQGYSFANNVSMEEAGRAIMGLQAMNQDSFSDAALGLDAGSVASALGKAGFSDTGGYSDAAPSMSGFDGVGGDGIGGGGTNSDGTSGPGDSTGNSSGGGRGADGWKDGGMIGDMPGLTKRYNNGGMVSSGPMLAMGYADGGMMGQMGGKPTPAIVNKQVDAMLRDPRARQSLLARPQQLMASGELTPDEVTTMARVAEASLYNPELYPQLRQFVAQQGMTPLPAAFDPSVIMRIMAIARGLQSSTPAGQVPGTDQAQMQRPVPGDGNGGYLQGPGTGRSDSIGTVNETTGEPVKVANGEYVIPAHVVRAKGREFFDNLLRRYSDVPKGE